MVVTSYCACGIVKSTMEEHKDSPEESPKKTPLLLPITTKVPFIKNLFKNKRARIIIGAAVAVPLVGLLAWWGWSNSSLSKLGVDAALVEGTVQFRVSSDDAWDKLQEGMSLGEGTQVRTLEKSRAVLNIDDGSAVRLNGESSVVLSKLTAKHIVIQNTGGDVYTRVVKSNERTFQVKSGTATYESLGTAYRTFNTDDKEGVEVYHSKVNILGLKADGAVLVEQGERYYKVNTGATDLEGKVTELSLEELSADEFVKWNSEQDKKDFQKELGVLFDITPPALEVSSPANGLETDAASVEVKGTAEAGAKILVNGTEITNTNGQFTTVFNLNEGDNGIKVEAVDAVGNKTVKNLTVKRNSVPAQPTTSFTLSGTKVDGGISFTWNISGISVSKGFKLVKGSSANPTYGSKSSDAVYIESSSKRSYTWAIKDGQTYHFRICVYTGSGCSNYSNDITVTAPTKPVSEAPTGTLTLSSAGGNDVSWVLSGSAPYGFKLVWSATNTEPAYGTDSATFYDKTATSGSITPQTSGAHYVRVCMYYDGTCKNYSNTVTINVP